MTSRTAAQAELRRLRARHEDRAHEGEMLDSDTADAINRAHKEARMTLVEIGAVLGLSKPTLYRIRERAKRRGTHA